MKNVEKWSLTYAILRPFVQLAHRLFYKEFHVIGRNNIPKDKPVIFAPNHMNGLMDDMIIVNTAPGQTVFVGRADIFKKKLIASFLNFIKIIPIYRIRDGKDSLKKNKKTFNKIVEILKHNTNICLYPEAGQIGKRSMLTHKKAIPRIVFLAHETLKESLDIQIIPVGITFSHLYKYRSNLVVQYGKPISTQAYCEIFDKEGVHRATIALREKIRDEISALTVDIPDAEICDVYESAFRLVRKEFFRRMNLKNSEKSALQADRYFAQKLNEAFETDSDKRQDIVEQQRQYESIRSKLKLHGSTLQYDRFPLGKTIATLLLTIVTLPITLVGAALNGWLFYLTHYSFRKKVKDYTFWSTISWGASLVGFLVYNLILWTILSFIVKSVFLAFAIVLAISLSGVIAWDVKEKAAKMLNGWKYNKLLKSSNQQFNRLIKLKKELQNIYYGLI